MNTIATNSSDPIPPSPDDVIARLTAERNKLREQQDAQWVARTEEITARLTAQIYDILFAGEPESEREVRWKWVIIKAQEVVAERDRLREACIAAQAYYHPNVPALLSRNHTRMNPIEHIQEAQRQLKFAGLYDGEIDGIPGLNTASACRKWSAINEPEPPVVTPTGSCLIADIYHGDDWKPNANVAAIIHKADEGLGGVDHEGKKRRAEWKAKGGLWGWYEFSSGADPVAQADFFLATIAGHFDDSDMLVLDFENSSGGGRDMTAAEAERWIARVRMVCPTATICVYGSNLLTEALDANPHIFTGCLLWPARYRDLPPVLPHDRKWHIWQFTAEGRKHGHPYDDMDKVFMSADELRAKWPRLDA